MNRRNILILMAALGVLGLAGGAVLAQGSAAINWWVIGCGGAPSSGGAVTMNDTLGQPVIGASGGGDVVLGAGYWYGEVEDIEPPKPVPPEPVGGHTEPVNVPVLPESPMLLVPAVSAGIIVAVTLRKRRKWKRTADH